MSAKNSTTTIPALPSISFEETLTFWQALGYELTYKQKAPSFYAVMRYEDDYELHFFGLKQLVAENNFTTCLIIVPEVEQLHSTFSQRLRAALGKVPIKGFPRISRMKPKQTRFTLTDVSGNSVIFIKRGGEDEAAAQEYKKPEQTPLQRAINTATRLRDFHGDDAAAAKVLDIALAHKELEPSLDHARVLAARVELAVAMDDTERARSLYTQLKDMPLPEADRQTLKEELPALDDFERSLI